MMKNIVWVFSLGICLLLACNSPEKQKTESETTDSIQVSAVPQDTVKSSSKFPFTETIEGIDWRVLEEGLSVAHFPAPEKSFVDNSMLTVIKIKPQHFDIELYSTTAQEEKRMRTVEEWSKEKGLLFVVNAGMHDGENVEGFHDGMTNRSLLKTKHHVNNPKLTTNKKRERAILALQRATDSVPEAKIIDLDFERWNDWKDKYYSFSQGLRLIDIQQKNRWWKNKLQWSMVIVAIDKSGDLLFIFTRSPYNMYRHIDNLLKLPLNIYNAMYLEGGPEASFYLQTSDTLMYNMGSYETNFREDNENDFFWGIANVIGVKRKN